MINFRIINHELKEGRKCESEAHVRKSSQKMQKIKGMDYSG